MMGRPAPTPAGVVHEIVKVACESVMRRPLSTERRRPVQGRPPMEMFRGSTPMAATLTILSSWPPRVDISR